MKNNHLMIQNKINIKLSFFLFISLLGGCKYRNDSELIYSRNIKQSIEDRSFIAKYKVLENIPNNLKTDSIWVEKTSKTNYYTLIFKLNDKNEKKWLQCSCDNQENSIAVIDRSWCGCYVVFFNSVSDTIKCNFLNTKDSFTVIQDQ